jgi:hypothetical protein
MALRLREMERRLKAEREGRLLDREGAKKRLLQQEAEKLELRGQLERAIVNGGGGGGGGGASQLGANASGVGERRRMDDDDEEIVLTGREFEDF